MTVGYTWRALVMFHFSWVTVTKQHEKRKIHLWLIECGWHTIQIPNGCLNFKNECNLMYLVNTAYKQVNYFILTENDLLRNGFLDLYATFSMLNKNFGELYCWQFLVAWKLKKFPLFVEEPVRNQLQSLASIQKYYFCS